MANSRQHKATLYNDKAKYAVAAAAAVVVVNRRGSRYMDRGRRGGVCGGAVTLPSGDLGAVSVDSRNRAMVIASYSTFS